MVILANTTSCCLTNWELIMNNAKNINDRKKPKTDREPRAPKPKINMETAADAIVDGRLVVPVGTRVVIPRIRSKKKILSFGLIDRVERGAVYVWDETLTQWFVFKLSDPVVVKVYSLPIKITVEAITETVVATPEKQLSYVISQDVSSET